MNRSIFALLAIGLVTAPVAAQDGASPPAAGDQANSPTDKPPAPPEPDSGAAPADKPPAPAEAPSGTPPDKPAGDPPAA